MEIILGILAVCLAIYVYYLLVKWFFVTLAPVILAAGCVLMSLTVVAAYCVSIGKTLFVGPGAPETPSGPQPAFKQYFFRKAFHDYRLIVADSYRYNLSLAALLVQGIRYLFKPPQVWGTWPLGVVVAGIVLAGAASAGVTYVAFGLVHLLLVVAFSLVALVFAGALRAIEAASMTWRRIFVVCPHQGCYEKIALPVYLCPACNVVHSRLVPGTYGITSRRCQCGGARLPTLFFLGRAKLVGQCPKCRGDLGSAIGTARNIHIPIVGGPATGKSSFLMATMVELNSRAVTGSLGLVFPEAKRGGELFETSKQAFARGTVVMKTPNAPPDAMLVDLTDQKRKRCLLYAYDAAGEQFQSFDDLRSQGYLSYIHGVIFLVDPFSLLDVQSAFGDELASVQNDLRPSREQPQQVYDRLVGTLRDLAKEKGRIDTPLAVVVTKADAFGLSAQIAEARGTPPPGLEPGADGFESHLVRQWLRSQGERNLVQCIENDFKVIRYFSCSSLGRIPDRSARPFVPEGVLRPFGWMLDRQGITLGD